MKLYKNKNWLYQKYVIEQLSFVVIGKICKCSNKTIEYWLKKHDIKIRTLTETRPIVAQRRCAAIKERFWSKIDKKNTDECWNWRAGCFDSGYGQFYANKKSYGAHVFSYELHNNCTIPKNYVVHHICNNRKCCNPNHLAMMPIKEHSALHRGMRGRNQLAKLTKKDIIKIRKLWVTKRYTQCELADIFYVTQANISAIVNKQTWNHI